MRKLLSFLIITASILSCTTLQQDLIVESSSSQEFEQLMDWEKELVLMMAPDQELDGSRLEEVSQELAQHEGASMNRQFLADLYALQSWAAWLKGERRLSENLLEEAQSNDERRELVLLAQSYLIRDSQDAVEFLQANNPGAFHRLGLREAWALFELGEYGMAVTLFDKSLSELPEEYRVVYQGYREKAWQLKDSEINGDVSYLLSDEPIELIEMIRITQKESLLLDSLSRQNQIRENQLYQILLDQGFVLADKEKDWTADRGDAALLLWKLYMLNHNMDHLDGVYSQRFDESPIEDLSVESPYFDAALGCVEREIMSLPDGRLFYPGLLITGLEYLEMLQALEAY